MSVKKIDCNKCVDSKSCCESGAWVDLEEAKKILALKLKGKFYHFEKDRGFPSGYKVGTSYKYYPCTFLTKEGLCAVHKVNYDLKPTYCKEFPYEDGKIAPYANELCIMFEDRTGAGKKKSVKVRK
ncbi:MAG: hypothetical protein V1933_02765 [Candidatus Omnitrophota bacterium]